MPEPPTAQNADAGYLRIGELARRVGVSPELLRAWERRYGLLQPERTAGGFRLYSDADEARVRAMQAHIDRGLSAAEAARRAIEEGTALDSKQPSELPTPPASPHGEKEALAEALENYDEAAGHATLDRLFAAFSLDTVIADVVIPFLHEVGDRWEQGELSVGQEHFASNVIRGRLMALARGWDQGTGPRAVLACAPGEQHDLGLACHGLALRARGWRISYLGANTPVETLADTVRTVNPEVAIVAAEMEMRLEPVAEQLGELARDVTLAIGGRGTYEALADRLGAIYLGEDPVAAAERLTRRTESSPV